MTAFLARLAERCVATRACAEPKGLLSRASPSDLEEEKADRLEQPDGPEEDNTKRLNRAKVKNEEQDKASRSDNKDDEKEEVKSLGRATKETDEESPPVSADKSRQEEQDAQALRRAETGEPENEEKSKPLRRVKPHDKQGDEEPKARKAQAPTDGEEEPEGAARAVRRSEIADKDPEEADAKPLRRAPRLQDPDDAPKPEETREEPEPSQLTALRRETAFGADAPAAAVPASFQDGFAGIGSAVPERPPADAGSGRPTVQIERLDVLVQEPAVSAAARNIDRSRSIRTRYLRRL